MRRSGDEAGAETTTEAGAETGTGSGVPAGVDPGAGLTPARARLCLVLLLAGAAVLFATGIGWDMPDDKGWAVDELHPDSWERAVTPETHTGWHARYPLLQFTLLHHLSRPVRWAIGEGGPLERPPWERTVFLILWSRWLSVVLALVTLVVVYRLGRRLAGGGAPDGGRRSGLLAAAVLALNAPFVYYAKTANLEAPYLLWLSLAFLFFLRLLEPGRPAHRVAGPRVADAVLFGLAAAAAVATKDQAYGLFVLAPLPVLLALSRWQPGERFARRLARAAVDRRFIAAGLAGAVGYALFQNLLFNRVRFVHHVELLLGPMSGPYREFGHGPMDQLRLAWRFGQQLVFALDPLLFLAAAGGVAWIAVRAWHRRRDRHPIHHDTIDPPPPPPPEPEVREAWLLGSLLVLPLSYHLTFVALIGFTFDRYVLPVSLILALAAGRFFDLLLDRTGGWQVWPRRLARAGVAAVFVFALFYASSIDTRMLADSRNRVEAVIAERSTGEARWDPSIAVAVGRPKHVPRLRVVSWPRAVRTDGEILARLQPRFVAVNLTDVRRPQERRVVERLDSGELGYLRILTHRGEPAWNLLDANGGFSGAGSNQRFVNPEFGLWERVPGGISTVVREPQPPGGVERGSGTGDSAAGAASSGSGGNR